MEISPLKLVRIDLQTKDVKIEELTENHPYFGWAGRALIGKILLNEMDPTQPALSAANKLIFANGFLSGTKAPNSGRMSIGAKSPLTDGIKESNVGNSSSVMLAKYGILAIILENHSSEWVWISISQEGIKIESAAGMEKENNYNLTKHFQTEYGKKIGYFGIGYAGYAKFKTASIASVDMQGHPSRHAGRGGLGAVMGAKKVKALIIHPTKSGKTEYANISQFNEVSQPLFKFINEKSKNRHKYGTMASLMAMDAIHALPTHNHRRGSYENSHKLSGEALHELILANKGKYGVSCSPFCAIQCSCVVNDAQQNHITSSLEYETVGKFGPNLLIDNLEQIAHMSRLCDDFGMDTLEVGNTIAVMMEAGLLKWGDGEAVIQILKGLYEEKPESLDIGLGCYDLGKKLGITRIPHVKKQGLPAYEPRSIPSTGITFLTTAMGADHTAGDALAPADMTQTAQKMDLSKEKQIYSMLADSIGICYFVGFNLDLITKYTSLIGARFGETISKSPQNWIEWAKAQLRTEIKFNTMAGLAEIDQFPDFFTTEFLEDIPRKWDITTKDLELFWTDMQK